MRSDNCMIPDCRREPKQSAGSPAASQLPLKNSVARSRAVGSTISLAFLMVGLVTGALVLRYGSLDAAKAHFSGGVIYVAEPKAVMHLSQTGDNRGTASFNIRNLTGIEIRIVGALSACTCVSATQLPAVLQPYGTFDLTFTILPNSIEGQQTIELLTEPPGRPMFVTVCRQPQ